MAKLAQQRGCYNPYVTNGHMTAEALAVAIESGLEAMNVDATAVKKFSKMVDVDQVWRAAKLARLRPVHIEITTLAIPTVNDFDSVLHGVAERIAGDLERCPGTLLSGVPIHGAPTPVRTLEQRLGYRKEAGPELVYAGKEPGHRHNNTYCRACGILLIRRLGFEVREYRLDAGSCPQYERSIPGVWANR